MLASTARVGLQATGCLQRSQTVFPECPRVAVSARRWHSPLGLSRLKSGPSGTPAVTTPHSGYHFDGSERRFFEGWYFKVALPEDGESFALIFSIEDPLGKSPISGVGAQVMGPGDGYIIQYNKNVDNFWAERNKLALGSCFERNPGQPVAKRMVSEETFEKSVKLGFQSTSTFHQGHIVHDEEGAAGHIEPTVKSCKWCFNVHGVHGWGDSRGSQKSTGGWLAVLPVFEPHWQVMLAHGLATGWFEWGEKRYDFRDAPAYYEKNWGGGFPSRWFWVQCNVFEGHPDLCLTAVGARRKIGLQIEEEDVGMIGLHHQGNFYELVPWLGEVEWKVSPWGSWFIKAQTETLEAELTVTCKPTCGTPLRAPLADEGLAPFCKDSFFGSACVRLWRRQAGQRGALIIEAESSLAAVEVGGGPWWDDWETKAAMKEPLRSLVQIPVDVSTLAKLAPGPLRPPGL